MDPFNINTDEDITLTDAHRILDISPDGGPQLSDNDSEISFGTPTAESTPIEIDNGDLETSQNGADNADDNVVIFFKGPKGGKNCSLNGRCYTYDR